MPPISQSSRTCFLLCALNYLEHSYVVCVCEERSTKQFWTAAVVGGGIVAAGCVRTEKVVQELKCQSIGEQREVCGRESHS